jgi:hypothetical protein
MLSISTKQSGPPPSSRQAKLRPEAIFEDLYLFASLCLAWLMVWRALHHQRKERAARLKKLKLVKNTGNERTFETRGEPQC